MDAVTYKCPNCGAALVFDPESNMLFCDHCVDYFRPDMLTPEKKPTTPKGGYWTGGYDWDEEPTCSVEKESSIEDTAAPWEVSPLTAGADPNRGNVAVIDDFSADEMMEMRIYHCKSCGAEIMSNDVEVSKFCSFCGQPAILFNRVSKEKKPDKIIPFKLTKEEALQKAKSRFEKAQFLDGALQDVQVDSVYGIYMPYWVFDSFFGMMAKVRVKGDKQTREFDDSISAEKDVILDASRRFHDDVSILLNPYDMADSLDFNPAYLSGFYADRCDVECHYREREVRSMLKDAYTEVILDRTPGVPKKKSREVLEKTGAKFMKNYDISTWNEQCVIRKRYYTFLPVYFITFIVENKPVILLVNGQTGKIVGNIPVDKEKVAKQRKIDTAMFGAIGAGVGAIVMAFMPPVWAFVMLAIIGVFGVAAGWHAKKDYEERYRQMNSRGMFAISKNREGYRE